MAHQKHTITNFPTTIMPAITASDLIFSEQANHNFSKTLGELKRSALTIRNRLESITHDAIFAKQVAEAYGRPLVANERCGSWYIDPADKGGSAYFKSTDGHTGVWKFSSRRLNLHLLGIIGKNDGCVCGLQEGILREKKHAEVDADVLSSIPHAGESVGCIIFNRSGFC